MGRKGTSAALPLTPTRARERVQQAASAKMRRARYGMFEGKTPAPIMQKTGSRNMGPIEKPSSPSVRGGVFVLISARRKTLPGGPGAMRRGVPYVRQ